MNDMAHSQPECKYDQFLDAKGLNCPLPVLKAKLILNRMKAGEVLCVLATDPHATIDFKAYCARTGHTIVQSDIIDDVITLYIERKAGPPAD
jgi:tRNA 2-thiouridine synthesizing protein A